VEHLDGKPGGVHQPAIVGQQGTPEVLRQGHVDSIAEGDVGAQPLRIRESPRTWVTRSGHAINSSTARAI
jgi:hypothetical protein